MTKATRGDRFVAPFVGPIPESVFRSTEYVWSPKLNGHRALLSGSVFISRSGRDLSGLLPNHFAIPYRFFTVGFTQMEGELVLVDDMGRVTNDFATLTSTISNLQPHPMLRLFVFDVKGSIYTRFDQRIALLRQILDQYRASCPNQTFLQVLPQFRLSGKPKDQTVRAIASHLKTLPYQTEGFVLRHCAATYEDPDMYKMLFVQQTRQTRARLVEMGQDKGTVVYADGKREVLPYTAKTSKLLQHIRLNMPNVTQVEVIVDTLLKKIVGLGTDWL